MAAKADSQEPVSEVIDETIVEETADTTGESQEVVTSEIETSQEPVVDPDAWRKPYEEFGFKDLASPEDAQARLLEAYRQRDRQLREIQERSIYQQPVQQQAPAQPEPAKAEPIDPLDALASDWSVPDQALIDQYTVKDPETGETRWNSNTPPSVIEHFAAYKAKAIQYQNLLSDPRALNDLLNKRVEAHIKRGFTSEIQGWQAQTADQQAVNQFFSSNSWLYEVDPVSKQVARQPNGEPVYTSDAVQFFGIWEQVEKMGVSKKADQLQIAQAMFQSQRTSQQQAPMVQRANAQPAVQQARQAALGVKNTRPARPTSAAGVNDGVGAEPVGASRMPWAQRFVQDLIEETSQG